MRARGEGPDDGLRWEARRRGGGERIGGLHRPVESAEGREVRVGSPAVHEGRGVRNLGKPG